MDEEDKHKWGKQAKLIKRKLFRGIHTVKKAKQKQMKLLLAQTWNQQPQKNKISH